MMYQPRWRKTLNHDVTKQMSDEVVEFCIRITQFFVKSIYTTLGVQTSFPESKSLRSLRNNMIQIFFSRGMLELHENTRWMGEHPDGTVPGMGLGYVTTLFESWPAESFRRHAFGRPDRFRRKDLDFEWGEFPDSNQKNQLISDRKMLFTLQVQRQILNDFGRSSMTSSGSASCGRSTWCLKYIL